MHFSVTSISEELTLPELRELMKTSNQELPEKIRQNYGGVEGLCTRLLTSPDTGNNFIGFRLNRMNDRMIFCEAAWTSCPQLESLGCWDSLKPCSILAFNSAHYDQ